MDELIPIMNMFNLNYNSLVFKSALKIITTNQEFKLLPNDLQKICFFANEYQKRKKIFLSGKYHETNTKINIIRIGVYIKDYEFIKKIFPKLCYFFREFGNKMIILYYIFMIILTDIQLLNILICLDWCDFNKKISFGGYCKAEDEYYDFLEYYDKFKVNISDYNCYDLLKEGNFDEFKKIYEKDLTFVGLLNKCLKEKIPDMRIKFWIQNIGFQQTYSNEKWIEDIIKQLPQNMYTNELVFKIVYFFDYPLDLSNNHIQSVVDQLSTNKFRNTHDEEEYNYYNIRVAYNLIKHYKNKLINNINLKYFIWGSWDLINIILKNKMIINFDKILHIICSKEIFYLQYIEEVYTDDDLEDEEDDYIKLLKFDNAIISDMSVKFIQNMLVCMCKANKKLMKLKAYMLDNPEKYDLPNYDIIHFITRVRSLRSDISCKSIYCGYWILSEYDMCDGKVIPLEHVKKLQKFILDVPKKSIKKIIKLIFAQQNAFDIFCGEYLKHQLDNVISYVSKKKLLEIFIIETDEKILDKIFMKVFYFEIPFSLFSKKKKGNSNMLLQDIPPKLLVRMVDKLIFKNYIKICDISQEAQNIYNNANPRDNISANN